MYTIRPFSRTQTDYEAIVAVHNAIWPEDPAVVSTWQHDDTERTVDRLFQRFVLEKAGQVIGYAICREGVWVYSPGKYFLHLEVHPAFEGQGLDEALYTHMLDFLHQRQPAPVSLVGYAREDKVDRVQFWLDHGFAQTMRYPLSQLDVTTFDPSRFPDVGARVEAHGIQIRTLTDLRANDPHWLPKLYELHWAVLQDVPLPHELTRQPIEEFAKDFRHPDFDPDAWFIAVDANSPQADKQGLYVGLSHLWIGQGNHKKLETGLTGVLRSHRRKGVALAMKLCVIEFARNLGADFIETENEENNPMYNINMLLGFQPRPAWLDFQKEI